MAYKYKASVIIPTYNREKLLEMTLITLMKQNVSKEIFEVIVVDDGSTDNTFNILKKYESKLNLQYLYHPHNATGIAKSRNYGIKCSNSEICIFIDSGILVASDTVENFIKQHDKENDAAVIGYVYGFDRHNENEKNVIELKYRSI
ncbi:glycosyltransferase family A protein [Faecalibacillus intestinalis]|uniref:glycosyltransferase family A protein n=1 Tax=Faecalibacillus intestinalis TaxID=1982626 RepID=UPI003521B781